MAKLSIDIINENGRKVVGKGQQLVELNDGIYKGLSEGQQLLIAFHERFVGPVTQVAIYGENHYVGGDTLAGLRKKFNL